MSFLLLNILLFLALEVRVLELNMVIQDSKGFRSVNVLQMSLFLGTVLPNQASGATKLLAIISVPRKH